MIDLNRPTLLVCAACTLLCAGCTDVSWPSDRSITTLRVLGVQAEPPTLSPGATTHLSVSCADGRKGPEAAPDCDVEVAWFGHCNNPKDNDPSNCFAQYGTWVDKFASTLSGTAVGSYPDGFGFGPTLQFTAPDDILAAELDALGTKVRYGVSYVYFMVCAGQIVPVTGTSERLPVECRDRETHQLLDQRSMVVGATTIYSYDLIRSKNPKVMLPVFDRALIPEQCASQACPTGLECTADNQCVPVVAPCREKGSDACRYHCLNYGYQLDSFSLFGIDGTRIDEPKKALWVDYYTNAGNAPEEDPISLPAPPDPDGIQGMPCLPWRAPGFPTEHAHIWTVVRDNRGGLLVRDQRVIVR